MSDLRDDKTETGCDLRTALEAERAAVGVGSSRIKHINSRLAAMDAIEKRDARTGPDERMRRALVDAICEIDEVASLAGSIVARMHKVQDELKALSRADEGKESEGGLPPIDEAMHTPEAIASLQHRAMEIESPSGPTPQDAQREAIARIIDPRAFIIVNPKRIDMTDRQRWAREKADAILALQTRAGG